MKYLLDVNALVALGFISHEFHGRVAEWVSSGKREIATCSITELGFVRVLAQAPQYGLSVGDAQTLLLRLKASRALNFTFIVDDSSISELPGWVKTARQITDGHLCELAKSHGAVLATLDQKIPRAFLIPHH